MRNSILRRGRMGAACAVLALASVLPAGAQAATSAPSACTPALEGANRLSAREKAAGWRLLWDGKTSAGWRSATHERFPASGWTMCGGVLTIQERGGGEAQGPGDVITQKRFSDFELKFDFLIAPGANSGVKIFVQTDLSPVDKITGKPVKLGSSIGMEYQVLDDARHPDAKLGRDGNRTVGSFYDVIPASKTKVVNPPGEWNHGRILARGHRVTFWLNGQETVSFNRGSTAFRDAVAKSKFAAIPGFGEWPDGHILLQDHGNTASFTNLKIRELTPDR